VQPLKDWYERHRSEIGDGEPQLLTLGPGAWTARIGSIKENHRRMFWLPKDLDDEKILSAAKDSFTARPLLRTVLFFVREDSGGFFVKVWSQKGKDPLIEALWCFA
jgi:hypothetical protein